MPGLHLVQRDVKGKRKRVSLRQRLAKRAVKQAVGPLGIPRHGQRPGGGVPLEKRLVAVHFPAVGKRVDREIVHVPREVFGARRDVAHGVHLGLSGQYLKPDKRRLAKRDRLPIRINRPAKVVAGPAAGAGVQLGELGQVAADKVAIGQGRVHRQPKITRAVAGPVAVERRGLLRVEHKPSLAVGAHGDARFAVGLAKERPVRDAAAAKVAIGDREPRAAEHDEVEPERIERLIANRPRELQRHFAAFADGENLVKPVRRTERRDRPAPFSRCLAGWWPKDGVLVCVAGAGAPVCGEPGSRFVRHDLGGKLRGLRIPYS